MNIDELQMRFDSLENENKSLNEKINLLSKCLFI